MKFQVHIALKIITAATIVLLTDNLSFAQNLELATMVSANMKTNHGNFQLDNFKLDKDRYGVPYLIGNLKNNTDKDWIKASFKILLYDRNGNIMSSSLPVNIYGVSKGETISIKDEYRDKKRIMFSGFPNLKKAKSYSIEFLGGEYSANYRIAMTNPVSSENLVFEDENISITWVFNEFQLAFSLKNKTNIPIKIDWNQVSYIDINGNANNVIHEGVKYVNRNESQTPTLVPPSAKIQDIIFPSNNISYVSGQYGGWREKPMFPEGDEAKLYMGKSFSVFMPLEVNGETMYYTFTFDILDVSY